MNFINSILLGSGLGFGVIFIPFFIITSGFENSSDLVVSNIFLSAILTGIAGVLIATITLPLEFSTKTIAIGIIALPIGSFLYGIIHGFLYSISHHYFGYPMENTSFLSGVKNCVFLATLVYGHVFLPLSLIATCIVQYVIIKVTDY